MARRFITAVDVRRLVKQEGQTELVLGPDDVVTALAQDTARDLGLRLVNHSSVPAWSTAGRHDRLLKGPPSVPKPAGGTPDSTAAVTADLVAQIVAEVLRRRGIGGQVSPATAGPLHVDGRAAAGAPATTTPGGWSQQEVIGAARSGGQAAGFRTARAGSWTYTPATAETCYVVEGVVDIAFGGQVQRAFAGDVVYLPPGCQATYNTPTWVKVFYVTA